MRDIYRYLSMFINARARWGNFIEARLNLLRRFKETALIKN